MKYTLVFFLTLVEIVLIWMGISFIHTIVGAVPFKEAAYSKDVIHLSFFISLVGSALLIEDLIYSKKPK